MRIVLRVATLLSVVAITAAGCASAAARQDQTSGTLVTREQLASRPGEPLERVLERFVPGIVLTRTSDGGVALRIRGTASLTERDAFPLYILDGSPIPTGPEGAVPAVDPFNIESIRVLKGSEAARYGIDGAYGVIVITTRRGPRS
ncbi:MAG TPA: TonB-dependent receptor plug domain-containing protein [Longimicrobiales bacterium]|nr:TonB-dependent receptor plug domain-containing protein [Longimicrobiales bacterium]